MYRIARTASLYRPDTLKGDKFLTYHTMAFQGLRRGLMAIHATEPSLGTLIQEEKDTIEAIQKISKELTDSSTYMAKWGEQEHFDLKVLYK